MHRRCLLEPCWRSNSLIRTQRLARSGVPARRIGARTGAQKPVGGHGQPGGVPALPCGQTKPFGPDVALANINAGLLFLMAITSLEVYGIIIAGWASNSKYAFLGALRASAQMVSYEIPLAICALVPVIAAGSLNLGEIGGMQRGGVQNWFILHDPFSFIAFFVYFVVATASCKRAPFDLAEAESELVGGFHTEYSGIRWSFFFMGEYASMFAVCGIASILFLGGWNTGIPPLDDALYAARNASGSDGSAIVGYLANVLGLLVFVSKAFVGVFVQIWLRWTLPRLRIDQVMTTCLKYLVPISCFLFLGATLWPLLLATAAQRSTWTPQPLGARAAAELRESTAAGSAPVAELPVSAVPAVQAQLDARPEGAMQ